MRKTPRRGNPHGLTVKQHCFPRRSIERFVNQDGVVHVRLIAQRKSIRARPGDHLFCAHRVWDQHAESGFMRQVEDAFQALADDIEQGRVVRRLRSHENRIVTDMYVLWWIRSKWRGTPLPDQPLKGAIGLAHEYSQDERDLWEKQGVATVRLDLRIEGRHIAGAVILQHFLNSSSTVANQKLLDVNELSGTRKTLALHAVG